MLFPNYLATFYYKPLRKKRNGPQSKVAESLRKTWEMKQN